MDLTDEQLAVLNHVVVDGQAWADRVEADTKFGEQAVLDKIERHKLDYDVVKNDPDYKTRAEREALENA